MAKRDVALMAHLMRRAGFGASYEELEARSAKGYEATVEELLDPDVHGIPPVDEMLMIRFYPGTDSPRTAERGEEHFMYHMLTSQRPLEEKITLFWHMVFATADAKVDEANDLTRQIDMFRRYGMGNFRDLLVRLAQDPAMIFWLDNQLNHKSAPNENWGRELLELFSMGVGNYTEEDVKTAARAFTGWTIKPKPPRVPYNREYWEFEYKEEDHDDSEKEFLGHRGRFNGEDIIDIIVQQPVCHRFIARHLYNYFVADEVQVPSWLDVPPREPEAIEILAQAFMQSGYDIRFTLRVLFNSDFFKDQKVWFAKVKNPVEMVAGTVRLVEDLQFPKPGLLEVSMESGYQGQRLINPPSVEGWHTGQEWIESGSLVRRVNFVADRMSDMGMPGIQSIIEHLGQWERMSPEELVDRCLELMGCLRLEDETRQELVEHAKQRGEIRCGKTEEERHIFGQRVAQMLRLIGATREYQLS